MTFCLPSSFFSDTFFWYDFGLVFVEANVQDLLSTPLYGCTSLFTPSSIFIEYCRVRTIQVGKDFWAVLDVISETALQLVYSPANTAQDETGLCSKGTLLAHIQLIYQVDALCPSYLAKVMKSMLYSLTLPETFCHQLVQKVILYFFPGDEFLLVQVNWKLSAWTYVAFFCYIWSLPKSFLFWSRKKTVLPEPVLNREHNILCYCAQTFGFTLRIQLSCLGFVLHEPKEL